MKIQNSLTALVAASTFAQAMRFPMHNVRDVEGLEGGGNPPPPHLADGQYDILLPHLSPGSRC